VRDKRELSTHQEILCYSKALGEEELTNSRDSSALDYHRRMKTVPHWQKNQKEALQAEEDGKKKRKSHAVQTGDCA